MRLTGVVALAGLAVAALAGCGAAQGSGGAGSAGGAGYVPGGGSITQLSVRDRKAPVAVAGRTLDGGDVDTADWRGSVVVVNVWGSWCPPCIAEADDLVAVHEAVRGAGVRFVGIDVRDNPDSARAHERRFGVTYPSIDDPSGRSLLAFRGTLPPQAIPSTLVLDREGRVAARVLGQVSRGTLDALVSDVLAEQPEAAR